MTKVKSKFSYLLIIGLMFGSLAIHAAAQNSLVGSYQLNTAKSENVNDIVENAARNNNTSQANREDLEDKLEAPERISIDISGNQVTLSTSQSSTPVSFTADGRTSASTRSDGSTVSVRVTLRGQTLTIASLGGNTDYTLTFVSEDGGRSMRVTRRITTPYLRQTVFADSFYDRIGSYSGTGNSSDDVWSSTDPNDTSTNTRTTSGTRNTPTTRNAGFGNYTVPGGTVLTGTLENAISTKVSQDNDRFTMIVESPSAYNGAIVEGYLSDVQRSGRITGRSSFTMNFETIRMRNGRTYDFVGVLQSVTDRDGKIIKVGDEGNAKGGSQTKESIKRGGIGAGVGAILGAIIGGGKGAIIGATIGGGAGAGSVIAQGKEDLEIEQGATISVESTSPGN
ncbi:MAG: hypothetical protein R2681_01925 [Pyrinomonadaceae bacterium]